MGYARKENPVLADLATIWDSENSIYKLTPFSAINNLFIASATTALIISIKEPTTQYASPAATAFDVFINNESVDVHLILSPAAIYADGAITLPPPGIARDKQLVIVNCTQQVTSFVVNLNGALAVYGTPSSLGADDFFTLKYDLTMNSWYRVG